KKCGSEDCIAMRRIIQLNRVARQAIYAEYRRSAYIFTVLAVMMYAQPGAWCRDKLHVDRHVSMPRLHPKNEPDIIGVAVHDSFLMDGNILLCWFSLIWKDRSLELAGKGYGLTFRLTPLYRLQCQELRFPLPCSAGSAA